MEVYRKRGMLKKENAKVKRKVKCKKQNSLSHLDLQL